MPADNDAPVSLLPHLQCAQRHFPRNKSELLHATAVSKDKTIKLYDGFYHALLSEPDGGAEQVNCVS